MIRFLTVNIGWKLLSLTLAILLWVLLVGNPELAKSISASVEFKNVPKEFEISSAIPEKVHLEIQGPSSRLRSYDFDKAAVILNLSSVSQSGERTFPIEQANVQLPSGVTLLRAVPSQLRFRFERIASREVPVKIQFTGAPPAGFQVQRSEVRPARIRIMGPESHVIRVETAMTDPIDLTGVVGEKRFQVYAYLDDPLVRFPASTELTVRIAMIKIPQEAKPNGETVVRH